VVDKILKATPNASVEQVIREALKMLWCNFELRIKNFELRIKN
jgi:hypothetical protein